MHICLQTNLQQEFLSVNACLPADIEEILLTTSIPKQSSEQVCRRSKHKLAYKPSVNVTKVRIYMPRFACAGSPKTRLEKSSSLPAAEADSTARIMASLSRAASLSHSPEASSSSSDAGPGPSSSKASFTSQRSGSPFTAKRDKSFLDVQRFLGDSLSKSASKGKSIAKQLQVGSWLLLICRLLLVQRQTACCWSCITRPQSMLLFLRNPTLHKTQDDMTL